MKSPISGNLAHSVISRHRTSRNPVMVWCRTAIWVGVLVQTGPLMALQTVNYSSEVNDRFSSGYPSSPVNNTSPNFIGFGLDWAGVGWNPSNANRGFGVLSPQHYLYARHTAPPPTNLRIFANDTVQTYSTATGEDTGFGAIFSGQTLGDLSLGTLNTQIPAGSGLPRYAVLDLNGSSSSNNTAAYVGLEVLLYGRGANTSSSPRIGAATISQATASGNDHSFRTTRVETQLEVGDSGSPAVYRWVNPSGSQEITLLGNHAAIITSDDDPTLGENVHNFTGTHQVMGRLNELMNDDGFALRVVGNPTDTWVGASSTSISNGAAWGRTSTGNSPNPGPSDVFVEFDGSSAGGDRVVSVNADHNLRGLYFLPTGSESAGFTFEGASVLTVGRGGITNYDTSSQVFDASLALGSSQVWNGGAGGIITAGIATNGHLLEIMTDGESRMTGSITGSGGLALSGGTLELTGANTYTGTTWVHEGTLVVNNTSGSGTGAGEVVVSAGGTLTGGGMIQGSVIIFGALAPGNSIGTLTVDGDVTWNSNAEAPWQFELGFAAGTQAAAALGLSEQDMLATGDFIRGSGSAWTFDFMGTGENGWYQLVTWDGTTNFTADDFVAINLGGGQTGNFFILEGDSMSSLQLQVIPEPRASILFSLAAMFVGLRRRRAVASAI